MLPDASKETRVYLIQKPNAIFPVYLDKFLDSMIVRTKKKFHLELKK